MDSINWSPWIEESIIPSNVTVVTVGYQSYFIQPSFLADFLHAVAMGNIQAVEKNYKDGKYQAILKGNLDISVEHLNTVQDNEPEIKKLRERLSKLEAAK